MAINATCGRCLQRIKVDPKFAGRKALCPVCEGAVPIPKEGEPGEAVTPVDFLNVIEHFKISDWDKAYCRAALNEGAADEAVIRKSVIGVRRRVKSGLDAIPIGELLVTEGILSAGQHKELVNEVSRKGKPGEEHKACPNCFEGVPASSKKCPYCGEFLGDLQVMDMCPNCKCQQAPGGKFCQDCGADMDSGLVSGPSKKRCPRCGVLTTSMVSVCPVCQTPFDKSAASVSAGKAATKFLTTFKNNMGYLILIALVCVGIWAYKNKDSLLGTVRTELHGEAETKIEDAVREWIEAVKYGDIATLNSMLVSGSVSKKDIPAILGHPGAEIKEIMSVEKTDIKIRGNQATVYVDSKIRIPPKDKSGAGSNIEALGNILGGDQSSTTVKQAKTTWRWASKDDRWLFKK
ncbi:zinc ribbon domain-containing protein [Planctomycetota bacterium]